MISLLTSNVDLKNLFAWFQLSFVFGSFNPGVGSLACGVNVASSKFSLFKYSPLVIISSLKSFRNSGMSLIVQNHWWARSPRIPLQSFSTMTFNII